MTDPDVLARADEEQYVHSVYESIAEDFSRTRYKPWPGISSFFDSLDPGSLGLDAGCGNGKYLGIRSVLPGQAAEPPLSLKGKGKAKAQDAPAEDAQKDQMQKEQKPILTIGLDRASGLVNIAAQRGHEVLVGDAIDLPYREGAFDFAVSIATIHHFSTPSRRKAAIKTILQALNRRHGKLFLQVWALEQEPMKAHDAQLPANLIAVKKPRKMDKLEPAVLSSTAAQKEGKDVFVPWKLQPKPGETQAPTNAAAQPTYQRYYHLFSMGELRALLLEAAEELDCAKDLKVEEEVWEQGNWCLQASFQ